MKWTRNEEKRREEQKNKIKKSEERKVWDYIRISLWRMCC